MHTSSSFQVVQFKRFPVFGINGKEGFMTVDLSLIDTILESSKDKKGSLIPILQQVQEQFSYLPKEGMQYIADRLGLTASEVYGVATFYTQFRFTPLGKHVIRICHGTACHVNNADMIDLVLTRQLGISIGETTDDGLFTLLSVSCLGCCSLAPVIMIDETTYGKLTSDKLTAIIEKYKTGTDNQ
jgi:NADH-quinone oxidoreductase subunit E